MALTSWGWISFMYICACVHRQDGGYRSLEVLLLVVVAGGKVGDEGAVGARNEHSACTCNEIMSTPTTQIVCTGRSSLVLKVSHLNIL